MNQPSNQTVGERLRAAREQRGISLPDAARATHIRANYLDELENDHPEMFLSAVQARGFLRLYAAFLGLPAEELINQWENPAAEAAPAEPAANDENIIVKTEETTTEEVEETAEDSPGREKQTVFINALKQIRGFISKIGKRVTSLPFVNKIGQMIPKTTISSQPKGEQAVEASSNKEISEDIFKEIGEALRARRQKMDLDLADVEHFTSLKRMYLVAMEDGRFSDLPSTVQGRGMLNNYARFLAMDESAVMGRYGQALLLQREEGMPAPRRPAESPVSVRVNLPEGVRRVLNPDLVVGGAIIVALFGFILWGAMQIIGSSGNGEATEAPSISEMLQITPTVTPTLDLTQTAEGAEPAEAVTAAPGVALVQATATPIATVNAAPLQLYIIANDRAYLRVSVDGLEVFNGRVAPANAYTYSGNSQITLLTGNAAALEVYFNQEYLGQLGGVGEVVNLRFAPTGRSTATPQTTPTPTATPEAQMTEEMMDEGN